MSSNNDELMTLSGHVMRLPDGVGAIADVPYVARRLVACWNACAGLPIESMEFMAICSDTFLARFNEFNAEVSRQEKELDTARTLLSDALETFDENPAQDHEVADRIRTFLKGAA